MMAGKLDRRISIQENQPTAQDASGAWIESWVTIATPWAEYVPPQTGREPYTADQHAAFVDGNFVMRYPTGYVIDPAKHRILYDGRTYNILGWVETKRREEVRVTVKARAEVGAPAA